MNVGFQLGEPVDDKVFKFHEDLIEILYPDFKANIKMDMFEFDIRLVLKLAFAIQYLQVKRHFIEEILEISLNWFRIVKFDIDSEIFIPDDLKNFVKGLAEIASNSFQKNQILIDSSAIGYFSIQDLKINYMKKWVGLEIDIKLNEFM